jgi:hypothetical protein
MTTDLTVQILTDIRDAARETNARLDQTNARLDQTNARLEETRNDLGDRIDALTRRVVESEIRRFSSFEIPIRKTFGGIVLGSLDSSEESRAIR